MKKKRFVDLTFFTNLNRKNSEEILQFHKSSLLYLEQLNHNIEKKVIKHCRFDQTLMINNIQYEFIKWKNGRFTINLRLLYRLRKFKPDAILVHSFMFEMHIILLRLFIGRKTKIMVQNHAEKPAKFPRIIFQKIASKLIDVYFIVSFEQAESWIKSKVFDSTKKIREMMEGSSFFSFQDKNESKKAIGIAQEQVFVWCGSLNDNKDPLTIINAFTKYSKVYSNDCLYMIYNSTELLEEVKKKIQQNNLNNKVILLGKLPQNDLEKYFRAADYFILGSHREGSGFSLCESMACGCIPIVTKIPSFKKMTNNGECGFLFTPENESELCAILMNLERVDKELMIKKVLDKFNKDLSFRAIATTIEKEIMN